MAHESQIVKDKENLAMSHGALSQKQGPGFNSQITGLRKGLSSHRRAIKEETIAVTLIGFITRHADYHMISMLYPTFLYNV